MFNAVNRYSQSNGERKGFSVPVVQELAATSLKTLPERYIRSEEERPSPRIHHHTSSSSRSIPTIDLASFVDDNCKPNEMKKLALACQEWGFFQVVNHGIPESLTKRMKGVVREFFQLPLEEKLKYASQGVDGYGQAFVASDNQKLDWADMILLSIQPPQKRDMAFWPTKPADFRETVDQYSAEIQRLGDTLLRLLAQNLGLHPEALIDMFEQEVQTMRINYYPRCPVPDLALGLSPHSDAGGITFLLQDDETVGLEVRHGGEWSPVRPIPNALVINIGDMVEVMSNGKYKSIEHRAITSKDKDRISIAIFVSPHGEAVVGPAPKLIDELNPCAYRHFKTVEYLRNYFAAKLDGKKAIEFAKPQATDSA